jgi:predicted nucleic acid-binding protein
VYRFDSRFPAKQATANRLLRQGLASGECLVPHQAVVEFVAAVTRPLAGHGPLMTREDACREAEDLMVQFPILLPNEALVRLALRGWLEYGFAWFDAQMWAYAEHAGAAVLYSEDFQHDRLYGAVRVVNPFL